MFIRDITPQAKVRHGHRVYDHHRIGTRIYRWWYDIVVENGHITKTGWQMTVETISPAIKPASMVKRDSQPARIVPDPYKDDPFWDHWLFQYQQWQESQKYQRI